MAYRSMSQQQKATQRFDANSALDVGASEHTFVFHFEVGASEHPLTLLIPKAYAIDDVAIVLLEDLVRLANQR